MSGNWRILAAQGPSMSEESYRAEVLKSLGAGDVGIAELLTYGTTSYDWSTLPSLDFPWPDEPSVPFWEAYAEECRQAASGTPLKEYLVQMQFPVAEGMSQNADYRAATRRATDTAGLSAATGLRLRSPERCRVLIHPTAAGKVPVLVAGEREDFVALVQALTEHNEPARVPDSMGACMVSGYNNLHRIRLLREQWEKEHPREAEAGGWKEEFGRVIDQPALYRDRFLIVSEGPYSNVSAHQMGLPEEEWRKISLAIRIEHECTHYFVRRAFPGSRFKKNMHEELAADYAGITAGCGGYRADWFLKFIGLEDYPRYRMGARLENYRGEPPLSDGAFRVLQRMMKKAAENLERYDRERTQGANRTADRPFEVLALTSLSVEELASPEGSERVAAGVLKLRQVGSARNVRA